MAQAPGYPNNNMYPQAQGACQPPPYAADGGPPPPAYVYQDPNTKAPPPSNVTVVVQPAQPPPRKKGGLFGSFMNEMDKVGKTISKEIDYASDKLSTAIDKNYSSNLLNLFITNNTIQLIPRSTQKTVQILMGQDGCMVLDANGPLDPRPFNTWFTVSNEGNNQVRLSNNNNYLAIVQGCMTLLPVMPGVPHTLNTKFQLSQMGSFVTLECMADKGKYIGFLPTGQPKLPCGIRKEIDTQVSVKLLSTAYPATVVVKQ